jgi:type I restriction enzyme S subunit
VTVAQWIRSPLGAVAELVLGKMLDQNKNRGEPLPYLANVNVRWGVFELNDLRTMRFEAHERDRYGLEFGDIVMCEGGEPGRCAIWRDQVPGMMIQKALHRIRPRDVLDYRFLYYNLLNIGNNKGFEQYFTGATIKHLPAEKLAKVEIDIPPLSIQRRIAGILSAYDDLIENIQQRIKILESMARALYREALTTEVENVALLPIVESPYWRFISENVSKYTGTKRYLATADIDGLEVSGPGIDYLFAEKPSRAQKEPIPNSVWFARMKETYKIAWYGLSDDERASGDVLSSGFAGFEARDAELWPLLFLILSSREFHVQKDLYCTGATQMSLTNEGLKRIVLPLPDEQSARRLGRSVGPMLSSIAELQRKIENLRRTRDLLLPRLLSGQIYVEETAL